MNKLKRALPYLLALVCLIASGAHVREASRPVDEALDMVTGWEQKSKSILAALPDDVFTAGYLERADIPDSTAVFDDAEFFITQYGVAPVVLVPGYGQEWIVGNFGGGESIESLEPWLAGELGSYSVQDLGFGIYLIHVTDP